MDDKIRKLTEEAEKVKNNWFDGDEAAFFMHLNNLRNIMDRIELEYKIKKQANKCDAIILK